MATDAETRLRHGLQHELPDEVGQWLVDATPLLFDPHGVVTPWGRDMLDLALGFLLQHVTSNAAAVPPTVTAWMSAAPCRRYLRAADPARAPWDALIELRTTVAAEDDLHAILRPAPGGTRRANVTEDIGAWLTNTTGLLMQNGVVTTWGRIVLELALEALLQYVTCNAAVPPAVTMWMCTQCRQYILVDPAVAPFDALLELLSKIKGNGTAG